HGAVYCLRPTNQTLLQCDIKRVSDHNHSSHVAVGGDVGSSSLSIIHFNDVYELREREKEPVGGVSRFKSKIDSLRLQDPLVLFSGDALSPSNMSTITKGLHMVPVLNKLGVNVAVYGNHDFDFGIDQLVKVSQQTSFPWLMSNVLDRRTNRPLAEGKRYIVLDWKGTKVGLMGLVEWEWLDTLANLGQEDVVFTDFVDVALELVKELKQQGCQLLIALTHMRIPNDVRLAKEVQELDLVLGGHDHHYEKRQVGRTIVLKSGSDFRELSQIDVTFTAQGPQFAITKHTVTGEVPHDPDMQKLVDDFSELMDQGMEKELIVLDCDLDGSFSSVRTQETNLGNLVADIMLRATRAEAALLNSGCLRSDAIHEKGPFKMKDLKSIVPMVDPLAVLEVTGRQLVAALENGVSQYPKHEGRFPQVSGIRFSFDPSQPVGGRVLARSVCVDGTPVEPDHLYRLCTKGYLATGKDGYEVFKEAHVLVRQEEGPILDAIIANYLQEVNDAEWASKSERGHISPQVDGRITMTIHEAAAG
ncbi:hypothetical protein EMCRGX_G031077, partial [Ephydatia muelleri]